mmetsp:Transcript_18717/g.40152  ORF Transcript_18717/g.40152 Transcript_18717/m.40152 type:complete len:424 (-) Transcript_18717:130-1401(-)|eukprot:CAMPEP_0172552516 /NCGR_PEP_ID=MMETSP1067-20121228/45505_1 /TAXON_ID=265564 ORGANISM="Thalassiosira punctigera, Strain Tpunct2005C2" /NCGR_SAMPLE_ID=MMETSP1067 /ASSEMBLY_ACC=CAM_ASM_000444 /LENGTH=423 /DNA_ID=CAMNT_0013340507 /DNA_START=356 /DNA_END=1627 /DNA_ORIENTATION=-
MKFHLLILAGFSAESATAFSFRAVPAGAINLSSSVERDVYTMADWAASYGVQQAEGVQLNSYDGKDYFPATQTDIPAGSPVMYVPSDLVISSSKSAMEFGQNLAACEDQLIQAGLGDKVPLFRVFFKVLAEYEKADESPFFLWLNSLPRIYNTGASMTYACFDCLPPYAAYLALSERQNFVNFQKAVRNAPFSEEVLKNVTVLKWAYNVALTRSIDYNGERMIAPMTDMFNHGTETEVEISYDENGDCYAIAQYDIPAGSPLRISYGDPTDPTPLFARYGFLDESSAGTFCKLMHMRKEMEALGYTFGNLLFYRETGGISPEVFDVVLYYCLLRNDEGLANGFYQAVMSGDESAKSQYQDQYWQYTKEELQKHVDGTLRDLDRWSEKANSYDLNTHPRVPLILQHNAFVKETFLNVKANLDVM